MTEFLVTDQGIYQNGGQSTNPFFMFEKVHFRLETTEPVTEFYIDWDDGDDNSPEKANIQHVKLEEPGFFCTSFHVYTKHGTYHPLVRVKNTDGFLSKWYTAYQDEGTYTTKIDTSAESPATHISTTDTTITVDAGHGITAGKVIRIDEEYMKVTSLASTNVLNVVRQSIDGTNLVGTAQEHVDDSFVYVVAGSNQNDFSSLEPRTLDAGQNEFSLVSVDSLSDHRIPVFRPANKPPIAVLKTDRNRIFSGINNEVLGSAAADVYIDGSDSNTGSNPPKIKVVYIDGSTNKSQTKEVTVDHGDTISDVDKILRVEIVNLKEVTTATDNSLQAGERIYLTKGAGGFAICNVSLGQPIVEASNPQNIATLDLSESRTKASNVSISEYYIDDGHHTSGSSRWTAASHKLQQAAITTSVAQDSLQTGDTLHANFRTYYSSIEAQHTFQPELDPLGTDGRYLSKQILCRGQVKDSSGTTRADSGQSYTSTLSGDTIEYSYLDHDDATNYYTTTKPRPTSLKSSNILLGTLDRLTPDWKDLIAENRDMGVAKFLLGGGHTSTPFGSTTQVIPGGTNYTTDAENYFLMSRKDKFDRIFIKTVNAYTAHAAPTLDRTTIDNSTVPPYRISIYYPSKNQSGSIVWKPLAFKDTTAYESVEASSLMRDGSISFKPPRDWEIAKHSTISEWPFGTSFDVDSGSGYGGGTDGPDVKWRQDSYALMICMATDGDMSGDTEKNIGIQFMKPYTNGHSQVLTMVDNTHVSLNSKYLTQSITFVRNGTYNVITNRLGKSEIRKIGAQSGSVKFGGTDLSGDTSRKDFKDYQQNGTPVYLDVEHENGDFTRFYGVIKSMSESHTTAKMLPKFSLDMIVSHIIEFDSSGTILSNDYISLGGNVDYESRYLQ
jgi:hypothetical protein